MPDVTLPAVVIARKIEFPDGDEGQADLIGVVQDLILAQTITPVRIYIAWEGDIRGVPITLRWTCVSTGAEWESTGIGEWQGGKARGRAVLEWELQCPVGGEYRLEVLLFGAPASRQSVFVRRV